jgi:hypothetical protein
MSSAVWFCDQALILLFRKGERSGERIDLAEQMDMMALCGVLDDGISDMNFLLGVLKVMADIGSSGLGLCRACCLAKTESILSSS